MTLIIRSFTWFPEQLLMFEYAVNAPTERKYALLSAAFRAVSFPLSTSLSLSYSLFLPFSQHVKGCWPASGFTGSSMRLS